MESFLLYYTLPEDSATDKLLCWCSGRASAHSAGGRGFNPLPGYTCLMWERVSLHLLVCIFPPAIFKTALIPHCRYWKAFGIIMTSIDQNSSCA